MLMHLHYEEETAQAMVQSTVDVFLAEADEADGDIAFWDTHGASEQRYYNTICIFAGGNWDVRAEMAALIGLPEDRANLCEVEFEQADYSWGNALANIAIDTPGTTFVLGEADMAASITVNTIREELTALNSDFGLENPLVVNVVSCGEPNAPPPWMPHRRARTP